MTQSHHRFVDTLYSPRASDYLTSAVHASGEDLDWIEAAVRGGSAARALDLGCGGGHVSYRVAPHVAGVVAVDLSPQMLETVLGAARERGLSNITTQRSPAEQLPFADGHFDFVFSRFSAHHWRDFEAGLREARRVLARTGRAMLVDSIAPAVGLLDSHLQTTELLRDASHVRNYTRPEWVAALARAGLEVVSMKSHRIRIEFAPWIARTRTTGLHAQAIRSLQESAPEEVRRYFGIEADGSFMLDVVALEARGV